MAMTAQEAPALAPARASTGWDRARWSLLGVWAVLLVLAVVVGERTSSFGDLQRAVDAGRVDAVTVAGGLEPGAEGFATQQVVWRDGWYRRSAEVRQESPGAEAVWSSSTSLPVLAQDVGALLRGTDPSLRVERADPSTSSSEVLGWRVPGWMGLVALAAAAAGLGLVISNPHPWRATRWAWFWVSWTPVGGLAFLLLSGPTPLLPAPRSSRRLTGGWAFLLGALVLRPLFGPQSS